MSIQGRYTTLVEFVHGLDYAIEMSKAKVLPSNEVIAENIRIREEMDASKRHKD